MYILGYFYMYIHVVGIVENVKSSSSKHNLCIFFLFNPSTLKIACAVDWSSQRVVLNDYLISFSYLDWDTKSGKRLFWFGH